MSTSANVTYYQVYKGDRLVGEHSQHALCKYVVREKLAKYQPASDYMLRLRHPDEDEVDQYTQFVSLATYLTSDPKNFRFQWIGQYERMHDNYVYILRGSGCKAVVIHSGLNWLEISEYVRLNSQRIHPDGSETIFRLGGIEFVNPEVMSVQDFVDRGPYLIQPR